MNSGVRARQWSIFRNDPLILDAFVSSAPRDTPEHHDGARPSFFQPNRVGPDGERPREPALRGSGRRRMRPPPRREQASRSWETSLGRSPGRDLVQRTPGVQRPSAGGHARIQHDRSPSRAAMLAPETTRRAGLGRHARLTRAVRSRRPSPMRPGAIPPGRIRVRGCSPERLAFCASATPRTPPQVPGGSCPSACAPAR